MFSYVTTRVAAAVPVLLLVTFFAFLVLFLSPGDPVRVMLGQEARAEDVQRVRQELGLDRSVPEQYLRFLGRVATGDLGDSYKYRRPVASMIFERLPVTIVLAAASLLLSLVIAIPLGIVAALNRGRLPDAVTMVVALFGVSAPSFWIALMLIYVFAYRLDIFPATGLPPVREAGLGVLLHLVLPALSLAVISSGLLARIVRSSMLEVLGRDFMRTATAKGLSRTKVVFKHGLRNAMIPVITVIGLQLGGLLGGAVVTETVFALPGVGRLAVEAIQSRDIPVVQGVVLVLAIGIVFVNLFIDLLYGLIDPRIKYG